MMMAEARRRGGDAVARFADYLEGRTSLPPYLQRHVEPPPPPPAEPAPVISEAHRAEMAPVMAALAAKGRGPSTFPIDGRGPSTTDHPRALARLRDVPIDNPWRAAEIANGPPSILDTLPAAMRNKVHVTSAGAGTSTGSTLPTALASVTDDSAGMEIASNVDSADSMVTRPDAGGS